MIKKKKQKISYRLRKALLFFLSTSTIRTSFNPRIGNFIASKINTSEAQLRDKCSKIQAPTQWKAQSKNRKQVR